MFTLVITIINIIFWNALHFGVAFIITHLPQSFQDKLFYYKNNFFIVKDFEIKFYKKINLPKWKDKLPQYNVDFNKKNLEKTLTIDYLKQFIFITCRAEIIHISIAILGYISLLFCFVTSLDYFWLFFWIATIVGFGNIPFCLIQRFNRYRLVKTLNRKLSKYIKIQ
jgi:glycosyl-4,4'-diaponeurosporenoate acyltransferase